MRSPKDARLARAVGALIHQARMESGLTIAKLASRVGVHPSAVAQWEGGTIMITVPHLSRTYHALRFSTDLRKQMVLLLFPRDERPIRLSG